MILTAHQPSYLPWLGFFHKIALSDIYVHLDSVQFERNSFTNRNKIKTANSPVWLTIPVALKGHMGKTIRETEIDNSKNWQKKHWMSLSLNYKKAPFFERYADFFENVYKKEWKYITELDDYMLQWFLKELGIQVDYYQASALPSKGQKAELLLHMSKILKADMFVFGAFGKDYVNREQFAKDGVDVYFQDYKHPVYSQLHGDFLPNMSIIDLLFNCGPKSLEVLMQGNETKKDIQKLSSI